MPLRPRRTHALREFFWDNNLEFTTIANDVRRYNIGKIFEYWYFGGVEFNLEGFIKDITKVEKDLYILWKHKSKIEDDYRVGDETYGYSDPDYDLSYINDRWDCAFRINWMLGLIERERLSII